MSGYIDFEYEPSKDDFITFFWVKGRGKIEKVAEHVAAESSVGTWTDIKTMNEFVWDELRARVFKILKVSENSGFLYIAYPFEHFDYENILQIMASVMGNIFGMEIVKELKLLDIRFPKKFQKQFKGPKFGVKGIRKILKTKKRPHVGAIVKPKVGLSPKEFAKVCYESWVGGVDIVKDDENLTNQKFCRFKERLEEVMKAKEKAENETGEKKIYLPNITDYHSKMLEKLDLIEEYGNDAIMVDVVIIGPASLKEIIEEAHKRKFIVHAHRAMHAAIDRGKIGISFYVLEKIYRILGVDQLHVGTAVGKMEGSPPLIKRRKDIIYEKEIEEEFALLSLSQDWVLKEVFPVCSGGLHPGCVEALVEFLGNDIVIQAGGGVHGHPEGTIAGAKAMREAVNAVEDGESILERAKKCEELKKAMEKWGYIDPKIIRMKMTFFEENKELFENLLRKGGYDAFEFIEEMFRI